MVENTDTTNKNVSLLEENIKTKGENAYYYAHKRVVDEKYKTTEEKGLTITGPGIITGGDPVLLDSSKKEIEVIKENKKFTKYLFMDDEDFATIKIDIPEEIRNVVIENVTCKFGEKTLDIKVHAEGKEPYFLAVKKLHKKVIPEECKYKFNKDKSKLIVNLKKKDAESEWEKLTD